MKNKINKIFLTLAVFLLLLPLFASAQSQSGFHLVTCGGQGQNPCSFNDLMLMLIRLVNLLFAATGIVAIYYVMMAAWELVSALGRPDKITKGKDALFHAVVGFAIVLLSFAFINLLLTLFGVSCDWWNPTTWESTESFYKACIQSFSP